MLPIRNQNNGSPTAGGRILSLIVLALFLGASASAQNQGVPDISRMSIEDLMSLEVTSVSKRTQELRTQQRPSSSSPKRTFAARVRQAFPRLCEWSPDWKWHGSIRTNGPLVHGDLTAASTTSCWCSSTAEAFTRRCFRECIGTSRTSCWKTWIELK